MYGMFGRMCFEKKISLQGCDANKIPLLPLFVAEHAGDYYSRLVMSQRGTDNPPNMLQLQVVNWSFSTKLQAEGKKKCSFLDAHTGFWIIYHAEVQKFKRVCETSILQFFFFNEN